LTRRLLRAVFFQHEEGSDLQEGWQRHTRSDVWDRTVVLAPETTEQVEDLLRFGHRLAEVAELISEAFQARAVLHDGQVALNDSMVLSVDVHGAGKLVVVEDSGNGRPDGDRGVLGLHDDVEQFR
jgi:hypothetical protein